MGYQSEKLSLLIVEDERSTCDLIVAAVSGKFPGIVTYTADDGKPGLELCKRHLPDIVVTDLAMPVMDGISMAAEMKLLAPEVVIIAVTGYTDTDDLLRAIEIGIDHYLLKPFFLEKLLAIIGQVIGAKLEAVRREKLERALRLSEERLQMTIANSPVTASSQDLDLRYTWACNAQMGYPADFVMGKTDDEIFPQETVAQIRALKCQAIAEGTGVREEVKVAGANGTCWYDLAIEPLRNSQAQVVGITNIMVDITKRKLAEERILDLNATLERRVRDRTAKLKAAIREQEAFSYTVSHDLRAPLRHINSFSTLLVNDFGDAIPDEARSFLERIKSTATKMGSMIDHLLELSRISRAKLQRESVDLSALARGIATMLRETEPSRSVDFIIEEGLTVRGDPTLIRQLVQNLFSNAWKYSAGRTAARIELGRSATGGKEVFFVRDNGVGFDMAHSGQLFAIFQRLHGLEFEGMGIGLAIAHRIIQRHDGAIWAEGRINEGATFYFSIDCGDPTARPEVTLPNPGGQLCFPLEDNRRGADQTAARSHGAPLEAPAISFAGRARSAASR
jgi:PAS domain S-box-containing protein